MQGRDGICRWGCAAGALFDRRRGRRIHLCTNVYIRIRELDKSPSFNRLQFANNLCTNVYATSPAGWMTCLCDHSRAPARRWGLRRSSATTTSCAFALVYKVDTGSCLKSALYTNRLGHRHCYPVRSICTQAVYSPLFVYNVDSAGDGARRRPLRRGFCKQGQTTIRCGRER